jgi:hypothetical protein
MLRLDVLSAGMDEVLRMFTVRGRRTNGGQASLQHKPRDMPYPVCGMDPKNVAFAGKLSVPRGRGTPHASRVRSPFSTALFPRKAGSLGPTLTMLLALVTPHGGAHFRGGD